MLPISAQHALASRYGGKTVKLGFKSAARVTGVGALPVQFEGDHEVHAAALYVDVAGFARQIDGMNAAAVRAFLDGYYAAALPVIFDAGGVVDRIAGDGIVAVFSTFFGALPSNDGAELAALTAARGLIQTTHGTRYASKVALATGRLLFCKTGLATIYEEYTVVGTPLTELYRIEELAVAGDIVHRADARLGQQVLAPIAGYAGVTGYASGGWSFRAESHPLRGVNNDWPVPILREHWG
jgi:class 3 adenylate cyclase